MKTMNLLLTAVVGAALTLGSIAWAGENRSEAVELKTLPTPVQKTIAERAAGGKIVRVQREDDKNGRWNYEVVVNTEGKEWGFEVDPNGRFVKKHSDHTKTE
jgi:uncharacterized membrane protein YkoI